MTRIDFYILEDTRPGTREGFVCRLSEKAYQQGHRVYIHVDDPAEAARLDDLLWTFRAGSFIPHTCGDTAADPDARVHIGHGADPLEHDDVLINLGTEVPLFFSRFQRVAELVDGDEERRRLGRERFKFYRERGYELESHNIGMNGER